MAQRLSAMRGCRRLNGEYLLTQFYEIGVGSFFLVVASGLALGVVMTLHTRSTLVQFGATAEIPVFQSLAFFNEIGPLVAALLMAGRVGAGIGAQLANMRATEQIDAIETLSVDSFKLLVVTRVIACTVMLPLLTMFMDAAGIFGGFLSEHIWSHLSWTLYMQRAFDGVARRRFPSPHSQDRGLWLSHRRHLLLLWLHHQRRLRRRAQSGYQQRCRLFAGRHPGGRDPGQMHLLPFPGPGHMSEGTSQRRHDRV